MSYFKNIARAVLGRPIAASKSPGFQSSKTPPPTAVGISAKLSDPSDVTSEAAIAASQPQTNTAADAPRQPKIYPSARAKRPIGIFYDELSRGINPYSQIETCGVADVSNSIDHIVNLFNKYNIVKVRRVYSPKKSKELNQHCIDFSGLQPREFRDVFAKRKKWATGGAPVLNDDRFWPYVSDPKIAEIVQALLGKDSFEFGSAVAAHYSARGLHRDYRNLVESDASPYSVKDPQKRIIRILHYCGISGGALGYIPFSHNETQFTQQSKRVGVTKTTEWFNRHRDVLTQARLQRDFVEADEIERHVCWAYADPGDIIISNSAMLHCGEYLIGPRYFFVSTYAENNPETINIAAGQAKTEKSREYHAYMAKRGFDGSNAVLAEAERLESLPIKA